MMIEVPVDILDHIFSLLVSDPESLTASAKAHPTLATIVEKYQYHHIVVPIGDRHQSGFELQRLSELISENPRFRFYVRSLKIHFHLKRQASKATMLATTEFAKILPSFAVLESIMFDSTETSDDIEWEALPKSFQIALEQIFHLPTLSEVHVAGGWVFPLFMLDNCENIERLSITCVADVESPTPDSVAHPQLKSLVVDHIDRQTSWPLPWLKHHVNKLQSLKWVLSSESHLTEMFRLCSTTLNWFDLDLTRSADWYYPNQGNEEEVAMTPESSYIPPNLQQLTLRTAIGVADHLGRPQLLAAVSFIKIFISSIQHLVLDIDIKVSDFPGLTKLDFSPLAALGKLSIPRIDLYVHTGCLPPTLTRAQLFISLEGYEGIVKSIKDGVLVIRSEKVAPG